MSKADVPDKVHKEVKKFALEHDLTIKDAYVCLIQYALEQRHDKLALKKMLHDGAGSQDDIIVGS